MLSSRQREPVRRARRLVAPQALAWLHTYNHAILVHVTAIDQRDHHVLQLVSRFKQLTTAHIRELLFFGLKSNMPCHRSLTRLVDRGYLARVERRLVGGARGGSGLYCYQLGRKGWALMHEGEPFTVWRSINYHALATADTYVELVRLERQGNLEIVGYLTEPECHMSVGGNEIKPDLYIELARPSGGNVHLFIEQDQGTQSRRVILAKVHRYYAAYQSDELEDFPATVFICIDEPRRRELAWLLRDLKPEIQKLFRVMTLEGFKQSF